MDNHFFKRKYTSIIFMGSFIKAWQTFLTKQKTQTEGLLMKCYINNSFDRHLDYAAL